MALNLGTLFGSIGMDIGPLESSLDKATEKVRGFGGKGAALAAAGGALIGGGIAAGILGAMDIQSANAKLTAQLDLSVSDSARYGRLAGDIYAGNYGDSIGGVNDALRAVSQDIGANLDNGALEDLSKKALNTASVFDQDLGGVTRAVGQLMKTGLAKDATQAFDIVTKGLQSPANKAGDLLDTFNEYGTQFRKLGIDGPTALGLISQGLQGGARDSDIVADAFKEFSIRAIDGSKTTAAGFAAIGLNAKTTAADIGAGGKRAADATELVLQKLRGIKDPAAQAAAATALFGTQSEDLGKALFGLDLNTAAKGMDGLAGAASRVDAVVGATASGNLEGFKRQAQMLFVNVIGGYAVPIVTKIATTLNTSFGPAVAAVSGVLTNQLIPAVQAAGRFIGAHETTFKIVAGIILGVLVPALVVLAVSATTNAAAVVVAWLTQQAAAVAAGARTLLTLTLVAAQWVASAARSMASAAIMAAAWLISIGPIAIVVAAIVGVVILIVKNWDRVVAATKAAWSAVVAAVKWWIDLVLTVIRTYIGLWVSAFQAIAKLPGIVAGFFGRIVAAVTGKVTEVLAYVKGIPGRIIGALGDLGRLLFTKGQQVISGLIDGIKSKIGDIAGAMGSVVGKIGSFLPGSPVKEGPLRVLNNGYAGGQISRMLADGITSQAGTVADASGRLAAMVRLPAGTNVPRLAAPTFTAPSIELGGASGVRGGDGAAAALHIQHYHESERGDVRATAEELYLLTKARG